MADSHGVAAGHSGIHIFLEHCTDAFLNEHDPAWDQEFAKQVRARASVRRTELLAKARQATGVPDLAIQALEESLPHHFELEKLDVMDGAARKPESCVRFKAALADRLATGAAFVSLYFDRITHGIAAPPDAAPPKAEEIRAYADLPYPWFRCPPGPWRHIGDR
jgi:hypothetical protein